MWVEITSSETLHGTHGRTDACIEFVYAETVEQAELGVDHVEYGEDGEASCPGLSSGLFDGGGTGRAIAATDNVCADDKEVVSVDGLARTNKFFPPAWGGVGRRGCGMR